MKIIRTFSIIIIAFFLVLLDVSFFSSFEILGVTFLSALVVLLVFSLVGVYREFVVLAVALVFFFNIFSSLPVWLILVIFLFIPAALTYLRTTYLPEISLPVAIIFLALTCLAFELTLLLSAQEWSRIGLEKVLVFTAVNSGIGLLIFSGVRRLGGNRGKIKF